MQERGCVLAEGEDAESNEFEFSVGCGGSIGGIIERTSKVHKILTTAAGVLRDLEKNLVYERRSHVSHS